MCNDAILKQDYLGYWIVKGDPTEGALITLSRKANKIPQKISKKATIPFDSAYKYMAVLAECENKNIVFIKGAPDRLLEMAQLQQSTNGVKSIDIDYWKTKIKNLTHEGKRVWFFFTLVESFSSSFFFSFFFLLPKKALSYFSYFYIAKHKLQNDT